MNPRPPLWLLALIAGALAGLWMLRQALAPFFVAMVLAYLLSPPVERLAPRIGRSRAVLLVVSVFFAGLVGLGFLLAPWLQDQGSRLLGSFPQWKAQLLARTEPWMQAHPWIQERLREALEGFDGGILLRGLWVAGSGLLSLFLRAMALILVPVILTYLLLDAPALMQGMEALLPVRHQERIRGLVLEVHRRLGGYIRGQMAVAAAMSLAQGLAFGLLGVPYAWLLGLVAGFSNFVPYSPYLTALVPALVLETLGGGGAGRLLLLSGVFTGVQKLEALYLTPVWVGRASRLHPLEVLLAVLAFGSVFGLLGLIFAVPLMILANVLTGELLTSYRSLDWFRDTFGSVGLSQDLPVEKLEGCAQPSSSIETEL